MSLVADYGSDESEGEQSQGEGAAPPAPARFEPASTARTAGKAASAASQPGAARASPVAPTSKAAQRLQRLVSTRKLPPQFPLAAVQEALRETSEKGSSGAGAGAGPTPTTGPVEGEEGEDTDAGGEEGDTRLSFLPPPKHGGARSRKRPRPAAAGKPGPQTGTTAPPAEDPRREEGNGRAEEAEALQAAQGGDFFNLAAASRAASAPSPEGASAPASAAEGSVAAAVHPPLSAAAGPVAPGGPAFPPAPEGAVAAPYPSADAAWAAQMAPAAQLAQGAPLSRKEQRRLEMQLARGEVPMTALPSVSHDDLEFDPRNAGTGMNKPTGPSVSRMAKSRHQLSSLLAHAAANKDEIEEKNYRNAQKARAKKKVYGWA